MQEFLTETIEIFTAGGWLMCILLPAAFFIWFIYLLYYVDLRNILETPGINELFLPDPQFTESHTLVAAFEKRNPDSLEKTIPALVRGIFKGRVYGMPFQDLFNQYKQRLLGRFSHSFYVLGALVTAAPLLGLLGTVLGMMETFQGVAVESGESVEVVAQGISKALITTQAGLLAALPGTFALAHLYQLYKRLQNMLDECECRLSLLFHYNPQTSPEQL